MPAPKPRRRRVFEGILSATELAFAHDAIDRPGDSFEAMALFEGLDHRNPKSRAGLVWRSAHPSALRDWIRRHPGTRPRCWWAFDASDPLRAVVRGRGEPTCGLLDVEYGRPYHWREWSDDLAIESEAAYLRRHGLMTAGEAQRLHASSFEPEQIHHRVRLKCMSHESEDP